MTAKVLVVDDEPDLEDLVRQRFRRQIKEGSISFGFARDGVEALALLAAQGDFDMVVTDINMPRMDGLTLLAKLQEEATKFSTVIVSACGDMANIRTAMNRGAFDFLTKPIETMFGQHALLTHIQYDGFAAGHFHRLSGPVRENGPRERRHVANWARSKFWTGCAAIRVAIPCECRHCRPWALPTTAARNPATAIASSLVNCSTSILRS